MAFQSHFVIFVGIYCSLLISIVAGNNRTSKQFNTFEGGGINPIAPPPQPPPPYHTYHVSVSGNGRQQKPAGYFKVPFSDGYKPGRLPSDSSSDGYIPGPPPPHLQFDFQPPQTNYRPPPGPPPPPKYESGGYFSTNYMSMPVKDPSSSSSYNSPLFPVLYQGFPSETHPENSPNGYKQGPPPPFGNYSPNYGALASAAAASASASGSIHTYPPYGWGWSPPAATPTPPPPPPTNPPPPPAPKPEAPISSSAASEESYGWGLPPVPLYPPRPVPEFSHQFSLRPSAFGWETSYNVPCGNYKIQPRVIAHLRLATQAVLPKPTSPKFDTPSQNNHEEGEEVDYEIKKRRKRQTQQILLHGNVPGRRDESLYTFLDPFKLERSLHYSPYHKQQFSVPKPTFRPRMCRWNFDAMGGCTLNFKCGWFQLPALFRCEENSLHVSDGTLLLDRKFCGNRLPRLREAYSSSSGKLSLTFKSEGAALPAILDCTVLCIPEDGLSSDFKTTPATTELPTIDFSSPPSSLPILDIMSHDASSHILNRPSNPNNKVNNGIGSSSVVSSSSSSNKRRNTTKRPAKPQLRKGNCKCGVPDSHYSSKVVHGRIVGGSSMIPGESPWTAALVKKNSNRPYCGASLINNRFLLTAAHCVFNQARKSKDNNGYYAGNNNGYGGWNKTLLPLPVTERFHFDVLLNEHDISQRNEIAGGTIRAEVDKVIIHDRYNNVTFDFDAALIRLAQPLEFNPWEEPNSRRRPPTSASFDKYSGFPFYYNTFDFHSLKRKRRFVKFPEVEARAVPPKPVPICLPEEDLTGKGKGQEERKGRNGVTTAAVNDDYALVTGWGLVSEGGVPSNEMLKARVQIFNDSTCQELYKKHNYIVTDNMICAGYINGKVDACVGDSGSPLATEEGDRFVLTGVVSWGRGCGRKQLPGVYTKVTELMDWIYDEATTDDTVWCS